MHAYSLVGASGPGARKKTAIVPFGIALAVALAIAATWSVEPLQAGGVTLQDMDDDGVPDDQEDVLHTSSDRPDTDGDGWTDVEEFARQSSPTSAASTPDPGDTLTVGMSARGGNSLNLFAAMYSADGVTLDKTVRFGMLNQGRIISLPYNWLMTRAEIATFPASGSGSITTFDFTIPETHVLTNSQATYFAVVGIPGELHYESASVVDLFVSENVLILRQSVDPGGPAPTTPRPISESVFLPIPIQSAGEIPTDWAPNEICMRTTSVVGVNPPMLTEEVVAADCESGWDAFCDSSCSASIGTTITTVDPIVLVGG